MITRLWPGLLLASVAFPAVASSDPLPRTRPDERDRPSHRSVNSELEAHLSPEDALAARLRGTRELKSARDLLNDRIAKEKIRSLVQELMRDQKFVDSIRDKFTRQDIEKLLGGAVGGGEGDNPELKKLVLEGLAGNNLKEETRDLANRVKEKLAEQGPAPDAGGQPESPDRPTRENPPPQAAVPPTPPPGVKPPQWKLDPKTEDWLTRNLGRWMNDVDKWAAAPGNEGWRGLVKDFARRFDAKQSLAPGLAERAGGIAKYMPRLSNLLPRPRLSNLPAPGKFPVLSRLAVPSGPSGGAAANAGKAILWLTFFGVAAFLLWRAGGWAERARQARAGAWRLGPWPVRPDSVTTRGELVRAFEYLALLCLGQPARTQHHLDLARRIAGQPCLDPDRRRDAAEALAEIYEHARYRPDDEPLPDHEIRLARRELCYLAGVAAA
jgi:hypothetical protein